MKLVLVKWIDARFLGDGWQEHSDVNDMQIIECETAGFLVKKNKTEIVVCLHYNEDHLAQCMAIPKVCIKSIEVLRDDK